MLAPSVEESIKLTPAPPHGTMFGSWIRKLAEAYSQSARGMGSRHAIAYAITSRPNSDLVNRRRKW